MRSSRRGIACVLGSSSLFAINASTTSVALRAGVAATDLTWWRCIITSVGLAGVLAVSARHRFRVTRREIPLLLFYGLVGVVLVQLLYAVALDRLSVSIALLLEYTAPVLVALWARVVFREDVRARVWWALLLALAGLALVAQVWAGVDLDPIGVACGLGAAGSLAVYWLAGERAVARAGSRDPLSLTFWGTAIGALAWFALRPGHLPSVRGFTASTTLSGSLDGIELPLGAIVAIVGVLGTLVPFVLNVAALQHITATQVGLFGMLEPVGATLVAWLWLHQALTAWQTVGVVVVVAGIALAQTARTGGHAAAAVPEATVPTR